MGFTLYNTETGAQHHYNRNRVTFGRKDLEETLALSGETIPLDFNKNLKYVSREHIKIIKRCSGNYDVMDLSQNGICVNGERVKGGITSLKHRDLIRLGPEDMDIAYAVYFLTNGEAEGFIQDKESKEK